MINQKELRKIKRNIRKLKWLSSYQSFSELGIKGRRNDDRRYEHLDFSLCKGKIVADYGCNIGQTSVKAARAGAEKVIGLDSQADSISIAERISSLLGIETNIYMAIDFNGNDFDRKTRELFTKGTPDVSFFLSVYRTKELKDRDGLFKFIIDNTKEFIFFEGHSKRSVDTVEYYMNLFSRFNLNADFLGYSQKDTRPLFLNRLKK